MEEYIKYILFMLLLTTGKINYLKVKVIRKGRRKINTQKNDDCDGRELVRKMLSKNSGAGRILSYR